MVAKIRPIKDRDQVEQLVNIDLYSESKAKVIDIIAESRAILDGHFSFGDYHSQYFLRFRAIGNSSLHRRENCNYLAKLLVEQTRINPDEDTPLRVLSPSSSGFFLAHAVAKMFVHDEDNAFKKLVLTQLGYMDRRPVDGGSFVSGSGNINPGNRVVVVNDIDHTGESIDRLIKMARRREATVEAVLVFATCNNAQFKQRMVDLGVKAYSLVEFDLKTYEKDKCPLCDEGLDVEPASTLV